MQIAKMKLPLFSLPKPKGAAVRLFNLASIRSEKLRGIVKLPIDVGGVAKKLDMPNHWLWQDKVGELDRLGISHLGEKPLSGIDLDALKEAVERDGIPEYLKLRNVHGHTQADSKDAEHVFKVIAARVAGGYIFNPVDIRGFVASENNPFALRVDLAVAWLGEFKYDLAIFPERASIVVNGLAGESNSKRNHVLEKILGLYAGERGLADRAKMALQKELGINI